MVHLIHATRLLLGELFEGVPKWQPITIALVLAAIVGWSEWDKGMFPKRPLLAAVNATCLSALEYHHDYGFWPDSIQQISGLYFWGDDWHFVGDNVNYLVYQNWYKGGYVSEVLNRWDVRRMYERTPPGTVTFEPIVEDGRNLGCMVTAYKDKEQILFRRVARSTAVMVRPPDPDKENHPEST